MIITDEWLNKNKTPSGGYNKKQFDILGIQYPPQKGWKEKIIGKYLSEEEVKKIENISNDNMTGQKSILNFIKKDEIQNSSKETKIINILDINKYNIDYFVYTDGACINNGTENAISGYGIYFEEDDIRNVSKKIIGKQSNNIAELQAIIDVFNIIKDDIYNKKNICIVTDSIYSINSLTTYGEKQYKNNWIKDIPNKDLVKEGYELYKNINNVYFMHIKAHTNKNDIHSKGNYCADKLANKAIGLEECPYNLEDISNKIYLNIPFKNKDEIKKLNGKWDNEKKKWYIFDNNNQKDYILDKFNKNYI